MKSDRVAGPTIGPQLIDRGYAQWTCVANGGHLFKPKIRRFLEDECKKVVDKLKPMSFADLPERGKALDTVAIYSEDQKANISVIVKQESPERLLVVVQCFMPMKGIMGWLRVKHVNVDGFRRYVDGRTEELDEKTIYEYD